jgi:polyphosphate kinase
VTEPEKKGKPQGGMPPLLNRETAILEFNRRVLAQARRDDVPLLERLRYVCIVSSNLDEFFEVRYADNLEASRRPDTGVTAADIEALAAAAHALVDDSYKVFNDEVMPALAANGIRIVNHADRNEAERRWVERFFETQVRPLLVPVGLDPAHPFPQVANKSLNFIARPRRQGRVRPAQHDLDRQGAAGPAAGDEAAGRRAEQAFVLLTSVIRAHLGELFPGPRGRVVLAVPHHPRLRPRGRRRRQQPAPGAALGPHHAPLRPGGAARGRQHLPGRALELPARAVQPAESALYKVNGPVNLVRMNGLIDLADAPRLRFAPFTPAWPASLPRQQSMFDRIRASDLMLHQPFESFEPVVQFMREAVADPAVLAIKQTIYRAGSESPLMDLLIEAARRGKEVMAVVELQARFDEEANINWAERPRGGGRQVVYGVVGLKTHGKLLLVTRREDGRLRRYVHLSTGNYNPNTARLIPTSAISPPTRS